MVKKSDDYEKKLAQLKKQQERQRNKEHTCKVCKSKYKKRNSLQKACSVPCAIIIGRKDVEKKAKQEKQKERIRIRGEREKIKTVADLKKDLQVLVNWIVRDLDKDQKCICRPDMKRGLRWDAGHFIAVSLSQSMRFDLNNIHRQGSASNTEFRPGESLLYRDGLVKRYGEQYVKDLEAKRKYYESNPITYTKEGLREAISTAKQIKKELKNGAEFTRDWINEQIGLIK